MDISGNIDVDRTRLICHLQKIVGSRHPSRGRRHLATVEKFIIAEFASYGLDVTTDSFYRYGKIYHNIVARLGESRSDPLIILGAHFDTVVGTFGADSNASGVAALLEGARLLSQLKLDTPMLFCAFNLKEEKMIGSRSFARKLETAGKKVAAMVSLESVGYTDSRPGSQRFPRELDGLYPDRGDFIGVVGNWESNPLLDNFAAAMRQVSNLDVETLCVHDKGIYMPGVRMSDHAPFWDLGYPALMITDTFPRRNPHYHALTDKIETLDIDFMDKVCEGVVRGMRALEKIATA